MPEKININYCSQQKRAFNIKLFLFYFICFWVYEIIHRDASTTEFYFYYILIACLYVYSVDVISIFLNSFLFFI